MLLPLSWAGIEREEISYLERPNRILKNIYTLKLPVACATLLRLGDRERNNSRILNNILLDLSYVVEYAFFDMESEEIRSTFQEIQPQLITREMLADNAIQKIKNWVFRLDELWMSMALIRMVIAINAFPNNLPIG